MSTWDINGLLFGHIWMYWCGSIVYCIVGQLSNFGERSVKYFVNNKGHFRVQIVLRRSNVIIQMESHEHFNGTSVRFTETDPLFDFTPAQRELSGVQEVGGCSYRRSHLWQWWQWETKTGPWGSAAALCTPHWAPLDVTADILYDGRKQTTQQKQADVDKRRLAGFMVEGGGAEGILQQNASSIPGWGTQLGQKMCRCRERRSGARRPFQAQVRKVKCQRFVSFQSCCNKKWKRGSNSPLLETRWRMRSCEKGCVNEWGRFVEQRPRLKSAGKSKCWV